MTPHSIEPCLHDDHHRELVKVPLLKHQRVCARLVLNNWAPCACDHAVGPHTRSHLCTRSEASGKDLLRGLRFNYLRLASLPWSILVLSPTLATLPRPIRIWNSNVFNNPSEPTVPSDVTEEKLTPTNHLQVFQEVTNLDTIAPIPPHLIFLLGCGHPQNPNLSCIPNYNHYAVKKEALTPKQFINSWLKQWSIK